MLHEQIEPLLTIIEVATILGIPRATLYKWRYERKGPKAIPVGKHLRYEPAEVRRYIESLREDR